MKTLVLILALLTSSTAYAEPEVCKEPQEIKTPCHGILLPPEAAASGLKCLKIDKPRLELKLSRLEEIMKVKLATRDRIIKIKDDFIRKQNVLLDKTIKIAEGRTTQIWESSVLWTVVGLAIGVAATIAITYAVND
jgi:hypothetical protein